uniref:Uncharacterized protein n=1 Tax=Rousettus aegyptiacus TaxID=9407 RepID=A0A7J8EKD6_ROUAE|nr:hypothetical protein HJG63_012518 [Rousettus aegyptiacus]
MITEFCHHSMCQSLRQECLGLQRMHIATLFLPCLHIPQGTPGCVYSTSLCFSYFPPLLLTNSPTFRCSNVPISQPCLCVKLRILSLDCSFQFLIVSRGEIKGTPHTTMLLMSLQELLYLLIST